jgi:tetratricopeptide (TPR) repeat protein
MLSPPLHHLRRALKHSSAGELDDAIAAVSEGLALCEQEAEHLSSHPRLTLNLGLFYRRQRRHHEAIHAVRRSLLLCADNRSLLHFLADLLIETGDIPGAAQTAVTLRRVCEQDPASFTADWVEALLLLENRIVPRS